jgi:hypothetical protein
LLAEGKPTQFRAYEEKNLGEFLYDKNSLEIAEGMFRRSVKDHTMRRRFGRYRVLDQKRFNTCLSRENG